MKRRRLPKGVYLRRQGDAWVYRVLIRLRGFPGVSRTFEKADEAIAWAESTRKELTQQRQRGNTRPDLAKLTIGGLIDEYLAEPNTQSMKSVDTLAQRLKWWTANYGSMRVVDFGVLTAREARARLTGEPATINRYLSVMRRAWNWGRENALVPNDRLWPTSLMLTEPSGRTRHLSDDEIERLLDAARQRGPTEYAMIVVALATGIRQGELLRLTWADIDFDRAQARILLTKTGRARVVHLPSTAIEALRGIRRAGVVALGPCFLDRQGEAYVKNTVHHWWNVVRRDAKLVDFRWHDLRHSCASFLAQNGATLLEIGSVLGHKSPSVTMRYAHLVQGRPVTGHAKLDEKLRPKR